MISPPILLLAAAAAAAAASLASNMYCNQIEVFHILHKIILAIINMHQQQQDFWLLRRRARGIEESHPPPLVWKFCPW